MAEPRNIVTTASVVIAIVCAGWAIYATRHAASPDTAPPGTARPPSAMPSARPPGGPPMGGGAAGPPGRGSAAPPVAVVSAPVRRERIAQELTALGTARANEAVEVTSKTSNIITAVRFRDGERVQRGEVLVELDSAQARADLAEAQAALTESTSQLERSRELLATQLVSRAQYEQLEAAQKAAQARVAAAQARLEDTVVRAPFSGRVGLRRVSVGSLVGPGTTITTLDDTSLIKLDFAVPESSAAGLREGLAVTARATAFPDREFAGKVASIDSRVDPTTRSFTVRALVPNAAGLLKPGMFLDVRLAREERDALLIPEEALVPDRSRQYVFVVEDDEVARREVRIGRREPGRVEIVAGLQAGERVVIEGTQKIGDGALVRDLRERPPEQAARGVPP